jgi:hypothetical protein
MRRLSAALASFTLAAALGGAVQAQITLVPGPPTLVAQAPKFMSSADFNKDGILDAVVTNITSNKVTVLLGGPDGVFVSAVDYSIARTLRGLHGADMNNDGNPDVLVVDFSDKRVYILYGNGDGTFRPPPASFPIGLEAIDIDAGNFDCLAPADGGTCKPTDPQHGLDMATANSVSNRASEFLNLGGSSGFNLQGSPQLGKRPKRIATADVNGDGLDDILAVNTGTNAADDLSELINNGHGGFTIPITNFVVGAGAADLAVTDINNDGAPDVLVLNTAASKFVNQFNVSVLINQTEIVDGKPRGTGFFNTEAPVTLTCPSQISGVLIRCNPNFIAAADFDLDGFVDFAVSFSTHPTVGSGTTPGLVQAFAGRGDGSFDFATQVNVGNNTQGIQAGDFTGDGIPDIAVAAQGPRQVSIIRSLAAPPRPDGNPCTTNNQCSSKFCTDKTCCEAPTCPAGERCDIPEHAGTCHAPGDNSSPCTDGVQCASGFCVDGTCCGSGSCPNGEFCNSGECSGPSGPGTRCTDGQQCTTTFCVNNVCCNTPACPTDQRCDIPGLEGNCNSTSPPGAGCTEDGQCMSGNCVDGVCCILSSCPAGQICNAPGHEGNCSVRPTQTPTLTVTRTPTVTPTPQPTGATCDDPRQCVSLNCVNNTCCSTGTCPTPERCDIFGSEGVCTLPGGTGSACRKDTDCSSNNCDQSTHTCGEVRTATPTPTPTAKSPGSSCTSSNQCPEGYTCSSDERVCCNLPEGSTTCPEGESCKVPGSLGDCTTKPTPTLTPTALPTLIPSGFPCDPNQPDQCELGFCTNDVCCDADVCPDPQDRCDIFGFEGTCAPPLLEGDECERNTDCEDPLVCTLDQTSSTGARCEPPPPPSPTLIPFTPAPTAPGPQVVTSRSGGCSIGSRPDGTPVWVLGIVPIALWLRRRQLHRVRIRERNRHE